MIAAEKLVSLTAALPAWTFPTSLLAIILLLVWVLVERRRRRVVAKHLAETERRLQEQARTLAERVRVDALTGLGNRARMAEDLPGRLSMARRTALADWPDHFTPRHGLALFMVDIDGLAGINQAHGRAAGDAALRAMAAALRQAVRQEDLLARWGDDELVVVGSGMHREGLATLAAKLLQVVNGLSVTGAGGAAVPFSCSLGFVPYPLIRRGSMSPEEWPLLIELVSRMVGLAKRHGGGRGYGLVWAPTYQEEQDEASLLAALLLNPTARAEGIELVEVTLNPPA
ncbi:MAG TPA: GGDEF domain-containing protein [Thermoanaerobaculaceae bacterium]|nr:GGDEF domain-containing protein [Thermoanaerobaculaceae bacterium]HRS16281.1 GGDEF domain-containing protein [Thermoanaerobaculaceae bacterium]